jgi:hypothetical protein
MIPPNNARIEEYPARVVERSDKAWQLAEAALIVSLCVFGEPVWNWLASLKPEQLWSAFAAVIVLPSLVFLFANHTWKKGKTFRGGWPPIALTAASVLLSRSGPYWHRLLSMKPRGMWAALAFILTVSLFARLISMQTEKQ